MGYLDPDGFYFHEEADIADPGAGFSDLLNKPTEALPAAVRRRVEAELALHPDIISGVIDLILASELGVAKCVHLEGGKWIYDAPAAASATHYVLFEGGVPIVRPTLFPVPSAASPSFTW